MGFLIYDKMRENLVIKLEVLFYENSYSISNGAMLGPRLIVSNSAQCGNGADHVPN
jgi:hypothetical protein